MFRQWIDFNLLGRHRLENVVPLPLGCAIAEAIECYGPPFESGPHDEIPELTQYSFLAGPYHEVVAVVLDDRVQSITYWSAKADPPRDLQCMLNWYREGSQWNVLEPGYLLMRADGKVRLWCSVAPGIGVAYEEFQRAETTLATANRLKRLPELADPTWVERDVIEELQQQFVAGAPDVLRNWANRSPKIAVSPDGRTVFIVRSHQVNQVEGGFRDFNQLPEPGDLSTQVLNHFRWSEDGASWGKSPLPTDAEVKVIQFIGDRCHLQLRQAGTNRVLLIVRDAESMPGITQRDYPLQNEKLWAELNEAAQGIDGEQP